MAASKKSADTKAKDKELEGPVWFCYVISPENVYFCGPRIVYINKPSSTNPETGEHVPAVARTIGPDKDGLYCVGEFVDYRKEQIHHVSIRAKNDSIPIMGPYTDKTEMLVAREKIRPKTDEERLEQAESRLAQYESGKLGARESKKLADENVDLKAKLAQLERRLASKADQP